MIRPSPRRSLSFALATLAAFLVLASAARTAEAKYVPPPLTEGHVVTTVGWLAPYDRRKIDEECEIAKSQTGYVIDVLLAPSDEPIDEISAETFQAWRPGDPKKDNGLLLVIQPNFPRGQRKARLQVGKGVEAALPAAKANDILRNVIGPLLNGSDEVRTAVATGVLELAKTLGADESAAFSLDAGAARPSAAATAVATGAAAGSAVVAAPGEPVKPEGDSGGAGGTLMKLVVAFAVLLLAYVGFRRMRAGSKRV